MGEGQKNQSTLEWDNGEFLRAMIKEKLNMESLIPEVAESPEKRSKSCILEFLSDHDAIEVGLFLSMWSPSNPRLHGLLHKAVADELSRRRPITIEKSIEDAFDRIMKEVKRPSKKQSILVLDSIPYIETRTKTCQLPLSRKEHRKQKRMMRKRKG